jgi:hypothetical protein
MFQPSNFCVSAHEIALPIKVFDYERFEMGHMRNLN